MSRRLITLLFTSTCLSLTPVTANAASITNIGDLPGGGVGSSSGRGISADGTTVVGASSGTASPWGEGHYWTAGSGIVGIGYLPGGSDAVAFAVNGDGSIIVGESSGPSGYEAFMWTSSGGMVGLGDLPGGTFFSRAWGISADGSVIVGSSDAAAGGAFMWTSGGGMVNLGNTMGGTWSSATAVNSDGTVIVGQADNGVFYEAFRWTSSGGMVGLGDLAGGIDQSEAISVNNDGSVIVGWSESASGPEAFRWTSGGGMVGLGDLPGGAFGSYAIDTNADGTVVVGRGEDASGNQAFRWTQATGMESLADVLTGLGVDLTGWTLNEANGVDDSGDVIAGTGSYLGDGAAFIVNLAAGGITSTEDLAEDLSPVAVPAQQGTAMLGNSVGQSLFASTMAMSTLARVYDAAVQVDLSSMKSFNDILPAAGTELRRNWSSYMVGTLGIGQDNDYDNHDMNGTFGFVTQIDDNLALGGGIIGSSGTTELLHGGESTLDAKGLSIIAAYEHDSGIRLYGTAFTANLDLETHRRYRNGAGFDTSVGTTNGTGYGAALRLGYQAATLNNISLMPYGEVQVTHTQYDAYTETGGAFPATVEEQSITQSTSKLGLEASYTASPNLTLGTRLAWAHRLSGNNSGTTASVTGFSGTVSGNDGDTDWAEGAITTNWAITPSTSLSAELSGRSGETQEPLAQLSLGLKVDF